MPEEELPLVDREWASKKRRSDLKVSAHGGHI